MARHWPGAPHPTVLPTGAVLRGPASVTPTPTPTPTPISISPSVAGLAASRVVSSRRTRPDVAFVDIRMPILGGIEVTRRVTSEMPDTRALVLTTFGADDFVYAALAAGASGFLLKDVRAEDLLDAVAGGRAW
jgi:CheY-like chemotaxis protein